MNLVGLEKKRFQRAIQIANSEMLLFTTPTDHATEYEGEFSNGLPHGNGTWYGEDGSRLEGQFRHGQAHGHGVMRHKNGDKVEGEFKNNLPHGKVFMQMADGERIEGENITTKRKREKQLMPRFFSSGQFKHGMPHGRVVWKAQSVKGGHRMDGMFRMGKPHGFARVYDQHENVIFEGRFINGRPAKPMPKEVDMGRFRFNGGGASRTKMRTTTMRSDEEREEEETTRRGVEEDEGEEVTM